MKKVLLKAVAVSVLATSSAYAMEDTFYVKANLGCSVLNTINKMKSGPGAHFTVGAGYHVTDSARVDLTLGHFNPEFTSIKGDKTDNKSKKDKLTGDVNTLMLSGYFDIFNAGPIKMFVGGGVGVGQVSAQKSFVDATTNAAEQSSYSTSSSKDVVVAPPKSVTTKAKQGNTFVYSSYLGASYEIAQGITGELSHSYRDMGKTQKFSNNEKGASFKGHQLTAGVRFDI